jgi:hypothetical protein
MTRHKLVALALAAFYCVGCMNAMEPTPVSSSVKIVAYEATGVELATTNIISVDIDISNTGTREIFVDMDYRRLEKLVNQRWVLASENTVEPTPLLVRLRPLDTQGVTHTFIHDPRTGTEPLLTHMRGVYRVGFRILYSPSGGDRIPAAESYSRPFAVTCC